MMPAAAAITNRLHLRLLPPLQAATFGALRVPGNGREQEEVERERGSDEEEDEGFDPMNRAARHGSEPECVGQVGAGSEPRPAWCGWVKRLARLDPTGNAVGGSGKTMTRTSPQHDGRSPWVDFSPVCQFATHGSIFFNTCRFAENDAIMLFFRCNSVVWSWVAKNPNHYGTNLH